MKHTFMRLTLLVLIFGASMGALAGWFGFGRSEKWTEEVLLRDGQIIVIEREQINEGGGDEWASNRSGTKPKEYRIRIDFPVGSGKKIEWRSSKMDSFRWPEVPLVFEVESGQLTVFTLVAISNACEIYSKYAYRDGGWVEVLLPDQFDPRPTNLLFGNRKDMPSLLNLSEKGKRNSGSGYRRALKQVGPNKKVCG